MEMMQPPQEMQESPEGFTVCVRVEAGKFMVGLEGQDMQEYATVKEALTAALDLIKGNGPEQAEEDESFQSSYTNRMPMNG